MPRTSEFFLLILVLMLMTGCEDNIINVSPDDPFRNLPSDTVSVPMNPINSKVIYFLREYVNPTRYVELIMLTEQIYGSSGYEIVNRITRNGTHITLRLDSIQAPDVGNAINSPAMAIFNLGLLPDECYTMDIEVNGDTVVAFLLVTDTALVTRIQPNNLIAPSREQVLRVPQEIIWGQAESIPAGVHQLFLDSLVILGAEPHNLSPGYYFYFSINPDGSFTIPSMFGMPYAEHYLYRWRYDTSITRNLVKGFAHRYRDSVYIQLTGGRGEQYYSTVLKWEP